MTGSACGTCSDGYFELGKTCRKCPSSNLLTSLLALPVFGLICYIIYRFGAAKIGFSAVAAVVTHMQILANFVTYNVEWPPMFTDLGVWLVGMFSPVFLAFHLKAPCCTAMD